MARLDQKHRIVDRMATIKQPFFAKDKPSKIGATAEDDVYGGMFMTQQEAIDDPNIPPVRGKQNKRRGTLYKHKKKIARASRKRNRSNRG